MSDLPASLAPWASWLSALTPRLALGLGPLLHRLDELVGRHAVTPGGDGAPDGYDGLSRRGRPERLVAAEWLLAQELPDEFWRRAVSGELLHLATARPAERLRGTVAVLLDTGPGQLGAARLVQLAVMVVLHRRAAAAGSRVQLGLLHTAPGRWLTGDLPDLVEQWLTGRGRRDPDAGDVAAWLEHVDHPADAWVLTGPSLAARLAPPVRADRVLVTRESAWTATGVTAVEARLAGDRVSLPLPEGPLAVRTLRGQELRRPVLPAVEAAGRELHSPMFPGAARRLLVRTEQPDVIMSVVIPRPGRQAGRAKRHHLHHPAVAVGMTGRQLLVLVADGHHAFPHWIGDAPRHLANLKVALADLDLPPDGASGTGPLAPLVSDGTELLLRLEGMWLALGRESGSGVRRDPTLLAAAPTLGSAQSVRTADGALWWVGGRGAPHRLDAPPGALVVVGGGAVGWSEDGSRWRVRRHEGEWSVTVHEDDRVVGLVVIGGEPALVTVSASGLIARLARSSGTHTLTRWSGGSRALVVHGTQPTIAVHRDDGRIEVGDLESGATLLTLRERS